MEKRKRWLAADTTPTPPCALEEIKKEEISRTSQNWLSGSHLLPGNLQRYLPPRLIPNVRSTSCSGKANLGRHLCTTIGVVPTTQTRTKRTGKIITQEQVTTLRNTQRSEKSTATRGQKAKSNILPPCTVVTSKSACAIYKKVRTCCLQKADRECA